jgi:hypothetical protein
MCTWEQSKLRNEGRAVIPLLVILVPALAAMTMTTGFVAALGMVAARADEDLERQCKELKKR